MSVKTARNLRNALFHVTDLDGTAKRARIEGYNVGGKTGTAHKVKPTGGYFDNRYTVSFVGMLPVEDPAFVCLIVIDDPHLQALPPRRRHRMRSGLPETGHPPGGGHEHSQEYPFRGGGQKSLPRPSLFLPVQTAAQIILS